MVQGCWYRRKTWAFALLRAKVHFVVTACAAVFLGVAPGAYAQFGSGGVQSRGLTDVQSRSQDFTDREARFHRIARITYPDDSAAAGVEGVVYVKAEVDEHGNVTRAAVDRVEPATATGLADSALAGVRNCTFEPARKRGKPAASDQTIAVAFSLNGHAVAKITGATLEPIRVAGKASVTPNETAAAENATSLESDYAKSARVGGAQQNTPEADARPGEYYFQIGANAYLKGDASFAVEMYRVSASWAYKPAEYNLGVMYARGQGVPVDLPQALAWMTLAAERDDPRYVAARDLVRAECTAEQLQKADPILAELKKTYGDDVALRRAKARWAEVRSHITGSRVGSIGHLDIGVPQASADPSAAKSARPQGGGPPGIHTSATTSAEALQGSGADGSVAYRQLLESDNPYDPKFERRPAGVTTVGPLVPIKPNETGESKPSDGTPNG